MPANSTFRQQTLGSDRRAFMADRQVAFGAMRSGDQLTRSASHQRFADGRPGGLRDNRNIRSGTPQLPSGKNLPANWRNHVVAQHSANWHRDWDRRRDHFFHGHRCRFVNGQWFIFDFGFDPYDYWYGWPYPYGSGGAGYYSYDYVPYYDDTYGATDSDYQSAVDSSDQDPSSVISAAQEQLARDGYYRGAIDGVPGPATRRGIARYQSDHQLEVTGQLNPDTLQSLGLAQASTNYRNG